MSDHEMELLESEKLEAERELGAAKRRLLDDPTAERDVRELRDKIQIIEDKRDALSERRKEEASAEAATARAAALRECREECGAALKLAEKRDSVAKRLDRAIRQIAQLREELRECDGPIWTHCSAALIATGNSSQRILVLNAVRAELCATFQSTDDLIAAELVAKSHVPIAGADLYEAERCLRPGGFLERTMARTAEVTRLIETVLAGLGEEA